VSVTTSNDLPDLNTLRDLTANALMKAGHIVAAQLLVEGTWTVEESNLRIEIAPLGKKALARVMNDAAENIIHRELQRIGTPMRFVVIPRHPLH
jgi:hypothetical protein